MVYDKYSVDWILVWNDLNGDYIYNIENDLGFRIICLLFSNI